MNLGEFIRYAMAVIKAWLSVHPALQTKEYIELDNSQPVSFISLFELVQSAQIGTTYKFLFRIPTIPDLLAEVIFYDNPDIYDFKIWSQIGEESKKKPRVRQTRAAALEVENNALTEKLKKVVPELYS